MWRDGDFILPEQSAFLLKKHLVSFPIRSDSDKKKSMELHCSKVQPQAKIFVQGTDSKDVQQALFEMFNPTFLNAYFHF